MPKQGRCSSSRWTDRKCGARRIPRDLSGLGKPRRAAEGERQKLARAKLALADAAESAHDTRLALGWTSLGLGAVMAGASVHLVARSDEDPREPSVAVIAANPTAFPTGMAYPIVNDERRYGIPLAIGGTPLIGAGIYDLLVPSGAESLSADVDARGDSLTIDELNERSDQCTGGSALGTSLRWAIPPG